MKIFDLAYVFACSYILVLYSLGDESLTGFFCPITISYIITNLYYRFFYKG